MLDPEQLAELRTTPCLVYDPLTGSVSRPPSHVSAQASYPRGQVRRSPQKFNELHMAKGCDLESEQLGEARSGGLSDEDISMRPMELPPGRTRVEAREDSRRVLEGERAEAKSNAHRIRLGRLSISSSRQGLLE